MIRRLLILLKPVEPALAHELDEANWLRPFGADIRYPGDQAETALGEEVLACQLAREVREAIRNVPCAGLEDG